jgi:SAM-dependent methyltransferase
MFEQLLQINKKPEPFEFYTAADLWNDLHRSAQMLAYHLNGDIDVSSHNKKFIAASVDWIDKKFDLPHARVCDFGCGPGLYTTPFAQRGATVTGVDFSERSIQYARHTADEKKLSIDYLLMNYLDFQSEQKFDLITMIMCDFCVLSPLQVQQLLQVWHRHLADNGAILFDVYSHVAFTQREETAVYERNQLNGFWSANDYYAFVNTWKYDEEKVVLDKYTIFEESDSYEVYNWLQHYSLESLQAVLRQGDFDIVEQYADIAGTPFDASSAEFAVVVRRK